MLEKITVHVSKTANGQDYVQISSPAAFPVNIVLVASQVVIEDYRPKEDKKTKK